jgi:hypothetical protein
MSERQGYGWVQTYVGTLFTESKAALTASADVSEYNNLVFQFATIRSGSAAFTTASVDIESSLNGNNWYRNTTIGPHMSTSGSSLITVSGRRVYVRALLNTTGDITSSLFMIAGQ